MRALVRLAVPTLVLLALRRLLVLLALVRVSLLLVLLPPPLLVLLLPFFALNGVAQGVAAVLAVLACAPDAVAALWTRALPSADPVRLAHKRTRAPTISDELQPATSET